MAHASLKIIPGVDLISTPALNQTAISQCNLIRFMPNRNIQFSPIADGVPQKLGGWTKFQNTIYNTPVRELHAWEDTNAKTHLAVGAEGGLYQVASGASYNISPQVYEVDIALSADTTTGSALVTIHDVGSNLSQYDFVDIQTHVSVGGLVLFGLYQVLNPTADSYQVEAVDVLGAPVYATSTVTAGGSLATFAATLGSAKIVVTLANHGLAVGDTFPIIAATTVGGVMLYGNYTVQQVSSTSQFTILAQNTAASTQTVTANGGLAQYVYYSGTGILPEAVGYGVGGYGVGGYGTGAVSTGSRTVATTSATTIGTTATVAFAENILIEVGSIITVAGVTPTGFNGTFTVTASSHGSVSYTVPAGTTGPQTVAGTITVNSFGYPGTTDWTLDNYGEDLVACAYQGPISYWSPTTGATYANPMPNAPLVNEGAFIAMPERQVIAYGSTFNGIQDPLLIRWSDIQNFATWTALVTNQAGSYRLPRGSRIVGGMQGPQQGLIWTDLAVWSMQYINQPYVYSFNELAAGCGLIAQKAAGVLNGVVYWMSQSQFFMLAGGGVQPVQCAVWDVVFQNLDQNNLQKIRCAPNSRFGEIAWYYPSVNGGGEVDSYVKYNALLNQWDYGTLSRSAWIDQSVFGPPIGATPTGIIYQHETSNDADGAVMSSYFQTGYFALQEADVKSFVDQVWPDMKWGTYGGTPNANVQITFYVTDYPGDTPSVYGPFTVTQATEYITPRFRGKLVSIRVGSNDIGSFWRLGAIRYRFAGDGKH